MNLQSYLLIVIVGEALLLVMLLPPRFYVLALPLIFPFMDIIYFPVAGLHLKLYNILTVCLAASLLYRYFIREKLPRPSHVKTSVFFLVAVAISILHSEYPTYSVRIVGLEALSIMLFIGVDLGTQTQEQLTRAIRVWLWLSNALAILEILDYLLGVTGLPRFFPVEHTFMTGLGRPTGWFAEPDRAAQYHMLVSLWTLPLLMVSPKLAPERQLASKNLLKVSFLVNIIVVILVVGRSAWLGMVLGTAVAFLMFYKQKLVKMTKIIAVSSAALVLLLIFSLNADFRAFLAKRLQDSVGEMVVAQEGDDPSMSFSSVALTTYTIFKGLNRPWIGHGLGTFPNYYPGERIFTTESIPGTSYEQDIKYEISWNRYAQFFYGAGLLGVLAYIIWQLDIFRKLMRSNVPYPYRVAFLSAFVGMFWGHDQFRAIYGYAPIYWLIGLSLAMQRLYAPAEVVSEVPEVISDSIECPVS